MINANAKKWFGAVVAAVTLALVSSVAPASAAPSDANNGRIKLERRDTGWDIP